MVDAEYTRFAVEVEGSSQANFGFCVCICVAFIESLDEARLKPRVKSVMNIDYLSSPPPPPPTLPFRFVSNLKMQTGQRTNETPLADDF